MIVARHAEKDAHCAKQFPRKSDKNTSLRDAKSWKTRSEIEYAFEKARPPADPVETYKRSGHTLRIVQLDRDPTIQLSDVTDDDAETPEPVADRPVHVYDDVSTTM